MSVASLGDPVDPDPLPGPERPKRRQHQADDELQAVLGDARKRPMDRDRRAARGRPRGRTERGRPELTGRRAEGHDDERDLETLEQDALERDGEADPVHAGRRHRRVVPHRRDSRLVDGGLVVLRPWRPPREGSP